MANLARGELKAGVEVTARVDAVRRQGIRRAHSATHILHYALQKNLGEHAQQQGSKVDDDWLRFDFTNLAAVDDQQLEAVENDVHKKVAARDSIHWNVVPLAEARAAGAMMLFGEKYPDPVRMVAMGEFSKELCGGTHLQNTSEVGPFEIISEEGVAAGTRRIVALTGERAREHEEHTRAALAEAARILKTGLVGVPTVAQSLAQQVRELKKQLGGGAKPAEAQTPAARGDESDAATFAQIKQALRDTARVLNVSPFDVPDRVGRLQSEVADLQRQLTVRETAGTTSAEQLLQGAEDVNGTCVVIAETPAAGSNLMRQLIDQVRKKASPCAVLLASSEGEAKVTLVAGVSRDLIERGVHAGNWVREVAPVVGGGGGGKPDMAQAGGKLPDKLPDALTKANDVIRQLLSS